jgi:dihydrofolate reductase
MEKIIIAAMAANRVIGRENTIPWHIAGEQKRFQKTTWGHALIMGRKTHESIGRKLPGRRNIIVTRNLKYRSTGCEIAHSLEEAYAQCRDEKKIFNIGGEELYRQGLVHADILLLTVLSAPYVGDVYFPDFSEEKFTKVSEISINASPPYRIQTFHKTKL